MTDRLDAIAAALAKPDRYQTERTAKYRDWLRWLVAEVRRLGRLCEIRWESLTSLQASHNALRQRHAEAVEAAFREGCFALMRAVDVYGQQTQDVDAAWLTSLARKGVARDE